MSKVDRPLGADPFAASPVTPGPLGHNDAADPRTPKWFVGDTPSPLGCEDHADPKYANAPKFTWSNKVMYATNDPVLPSPQTTATSLPDVVEGVAFIWADAHPDAASFYTTFPSELILTSSQFKVKNAVPIKKMTINSLLDAILKHNSKDVLVVSHGHGGGLSAPLMAGSKEPLGIKAMDVFAGKLPVAGNLDLSKSNYVMLKDKIAKVQAMGLRLVVLRACIVGTYPEVLLQLKDFFRCQVVCAPKAFDGYGTIDVGTPTTDGKVWEKWLQDHPGSTVEFAAPNRFAWVDSSHSLMASAIADSKQAVQQWVKKHLPVAVKSIDNKFPYHGFTSGGKVVFPGDPTYRSYLNRTP